MTKDKKIAIYSRKSKFTGKGESIENQIELCRQYVCAHHGDVAVEATLVYEDEGFSGGNLERPRFKKMMADAKAGELSAIIVYRLDRISRNIGDFATLIEELNAMKIDFVSIKEQFDTSSPMGRAMMYIASVFSQLERETIAERIRDNMHELSKTGRWLGGVTPTGYSSELVERVSVDGKVRKACRLKTIPEEAAIIELIYAKFLETNSLTGTDTFLLQNGYVTKNGKAFTRFAIKGILSNPVYMIADEDAYRYLTQRDVQLYSDEAEFNAERGVIAYNRTMQKDGKANKMRPMQEWIVSVGKHQGMISGAQWIKTQSLLGQNSTKAYRKPRSNVALLSGVLLCGKCGDYMRPKLTTRLDAHAEQVYTYLCTTKERSHAQCCDCKNASGNELDKAIVAALMKLPEDTQGLIHLLEKGKRAIAASKDGESGQVERLELQLADNEKEIGVLVAAIAKARHTTAEEYILKQIEALHESDEVIKSRIAEGNQIGQERALLGGEFDEIARKQTSFEQTIGEMNTQRKRAAIRACVGKVTWQDEEAQVYLLGAECYAAV